jgi:hypothetical protein
MEKGTTSFDNYNNPSPCWVYEISTYKILNVNEAALKYYNCTKSRIYPTLHLQTHH